jgi:MoaA/NifB/PqqE/SkfB family radical SAM enzyme
MLRTDANINTWCITANTGIAIHPTGKATICCKFNNGLADDGTSVKDNTLLSIFNNKQFVEARQALNSGQRHDACKLCFEAEDAGFRSKRISDYEYFKDLDNNGSIELVELYLGNTCNLKCRTCNPYSSSQWVDEYFEVYVKTKPDNTYTNVNQYATQINSNRIWHNEGSAFWQDLTNHLGTIKQFLIYGGEPWLSKSLWTMLQTCVDMGVAKNISLNFATNGTQYSKEKIDLFRHFKKVIVMLSIDAVGKQFEYIRHPAKWNNVFDNCKKLLELRDSSPNVEIIWSPVVSTLNIMYLQDLITIAEDLGVMLAFNKVDYPQWYNIAVIPENLKLAIIRKLEAIKCNDNNRKFMRSFISIMRNSTYDADAWQKFLDYTKIHDGIRGEDFASTFPELYQEIQNA